MQMGNGVQKISSHANAPNGAGNQLCAIGNATGISIPSGASPQSVAVTWPGGLPANYHVIVTPSTKATTWVTSKTGTGFTVDFDNGGSIPGSQTFDVTILSG